MALVPDDQDQAVARAYAHAAWDEFLDTMTDYRFPIDGAETPRGTAERLVGAAELADEPSAGVRLLGQAEERARYATTPASGELRPALDGVRAALAGRASRRGRSWCKRTFARSGAILAFPTSAP